VILPLSLLNEKSMNRMQAAKLVLKREVFIQRK
jgi:hypothetical protein